MADADVLTVPELARYLRVSTTTAYRMVNEGTVPHILIGRRMLIPLTALRRWLDTTADGSIRKAAS